MLGKVTVRFIYFFCAAATMAIKPLVDIDFGRSNGKPRALSQTVEAKTPKALETPKRTV